MPNLFRKWNVSAVIFAALAAGTGSWPAVAAAQAQDTTTQESTTTTQKKAAAPGTQSSTSAGKNAAASSAAVKSARSKYSKRRSKKVKGQTAPTAERINEIQEALASKGAFAGEPTGKWDASTVEAMKKFQASQGLEATGKLDALTLQKLGLGSQTAGLGAPTAPPNSINRLRNQASSAEPADAQSQPRN